MTENLHCRGCEGRWGVEDSCILSRERLVVNAVLIVRGNGCPEGVAKNLLPGPTFDAVKARLVEEGLWNGKQ